jgi:hypothetical protein
MISYKETSLGSPEKWSISMVGIGPLNLLSSPVLGNDMDITEMCAVYHSQILSRHHKYHAYILGSFLLKATGISPKIFLRSPKLITTHS